MDISLAPSGATVLRADVRVSDDGRYVAGTVLATWRDEVVVWTVGAYVGQRLECSNGRYFDGRSTHTNMDAAIVHYDWRRSGASSRLGSAGE